MNYWHEKYDDSVILKKSLIFLGIGTIAGLVLVPWLLYFKQIPLSFVGFLSGGMLGATIALIIIMLLL